MKIILYVDDNVATLRAVGILLREEGGYNVLEADDGAEALRIMRTQGPIDLLLVDHHMPPMNGPYFVLQARVIQPNVKVMFYSGWDLIGDNEEDFVVKGTPVEELLQKIAAKLSEP